MAATTADLEIVWPNGGRETLAGVAADQLVTIREGAGIVRRERLPAEMRDAILQQVY